MFASALLGVLPLALLQDPLDSTTETLVTAPRSSRKATDSPAHTTVIQGDELRRTGQRSLPAALAAAGQVWVQETNLGGGAPFLRGLVGNRVLIVIDGVRLNDSTTRGGPNQSLNTIDPEIVDYVEVVRGPSSVLYGSDAIGGAILIWTKRRLPTLLDPNAEAGVAGGAGFTYRDVVDGGRVWAEWSWANETDGVILIGDVFDFDDLETGSGTAEFTGYNGYGAFGSWVHAFDESKSLSATLRLHRDNDVPRTDRLVTGFGQTQPSNQQFLFDTQERTSYLLAYDDTAEGPFWERMQARFSYRTYLERRIEQSTGSNNVSFETDDVETVGLGVDFQQSIGEDHLLTFGFDIDSDSVESSDTNTNQITGVSSTVNGDFAPDARFTSYGVFLQDEVLSFDAFDLTLGVRAARYDFSFDAFPNQPTSTDEDGDFNALTASLQLARDLTDEMRGTLTVAQGYRAPNLNDLAKNGSFFGGTELANPDLDPEESLTTELAFDYVRPTWNASLAGYYTKLDDVIGRRLVSGGTIGNETFVRDNVGEADIYGVELRAESRLAEDSDYKLDGSLAWARGRQNDPTVDPGTGIAPFDGVEFRRIPPLHGHVGLGYEPQDGPGWLDYSRIQFVFADDQSQLHPQDISDSRINPSGTPGWGRFDLTLGGPLGPDGTATWFAGIENILDKAYRVHASGFDAPGRGLVFGLSWRP